MPLFGHKGSITRLFHKVKAGATRMFHKVRKGLGAAGAILDNPVTHAAASALGLGGVHDAAVAGIKSAQHLGDRIEHTANKLDHHARKIGDKIHGLAHSVRADVHRLTDPHKQDSGRFTHDFAHMAADSLQKAKAIAKEAHADVSPLFV